MEVTYLKKIIKILMVSLIVPIVSISQLDFINANNQETLDVAENVEDRSYLENFDGKKVRIEFSDKKLFLERAKLKNAAAFYGDTPRTQELYFDYNKDKDAYKIYYADEPSLILALDLYPDHEPNNVFFTNDGNLDEHFWRLERAPGNNKYYLRNYKGGGYLAGIFKFGGTNVEITYDKRNYDNHLTELTIHKAPQQAKNYINIYGVNYNGDSNVEGLKINLDYVKNNLFLTNRNNKPIHAGFKDNDYFRLKLLDKNSKIKSSMTIRGNDIPLSSKYDKFKFLKFNIGDFIELYHEEPFRIKINGSTIGLPLYSKHQLYEITSSGLRPIPTAIEQGVYNIKLKEKPEYFLIRNLSGFGVVVSNNVDKYNNSTKWQFSYDLSKRAYVIKNLDTNKFLVNKFYSSSYPNALQAVDDPMDDSKYFEILDLGNNEVALINLKTGLAITVDENNSIIKPTKYSNSNNQKFIIEKR